MFRIGEDLPIMSEWKELFLPEELPYDKFERFGPKALSDAELLAVLLRNGTKDKSPIDLARLILNRGGSQDGLLGLYHSDIQDLTQISGIGKVKAIQLLCAAEIAKRISYLSREPGLDFKKSDTVAKYYMEKLRHEEKENFILCMLDNNFSLLKDETLFIGTSNTTICSARDIFIKALKEKASYILILHNHPSGNPSPSSQDVKMTKRLRDLSLELDIPLVDHIIIGDNQFISFSNLGLL